MENIRFEDGHGMTLGCLYGEVTVSVGWLTTVPGHDLTVAVRDLLNVTWPGSTTLIATAALDARLEVTRDTGDDTVEFLIRLDWPGMPLWCRCDRADTARLREWWGRAVDMGDRR